MTARERSESQGRAETQKSRAADDTASMERPPMDRWSPATVLETPPDKGGYHYRWIREEVNGTPDRRRVAQALREGYVRVNVAELDDYFSAMCDPDTPDGIARFGGLILMKIPQEFVDQRRAYYRQRSNEQRYAVDQLQGVAGNNMVVEDRGSRALEGAAGGQAMREMSQR